MFDFLLVYPAAFLIGFLLGLIIRVRTSRSQFWMAVVAGSVGAVVAVTCSLGYVRETAELVEVVTQLALPAGGICFALGLIGTYLGGAVRGLIAWVGALISETMRSE